MAVNEMFQHRFLLNFTKYKYLLGELIKRDIKIKYRRSVIGIFWSFLNPLLTMIVLTIIFSTIFSMNIENFPVYFLVGKLIFDFFAQGSRGAMTSILKNASIIKKVYVPKYMYSLGIIFSSLLTFMLSLIVLFGVMLATNADFTIYILTAIIPIFLLLIFTIGAGLLLATVTVFFRDVEHLYGIFLTLLMYGSAIFYPPEIIPLSFRFLLDWNPIYVFISMCRDAFLYGQLFDLSQLIYASLTTVIILVLGISLFYKYQDRFILYI
jgi:lipopolysaccharide transport system permease protein